MRKDELCLVSPKMKNSRSPKVSQKEPQKFSLSGSTTRKVISAVAESTGTLFWFFFLLFRFVGIRALTEKRGRLHITRCSVDGKILSEHLLPVHPPSLYGHSGEPPSIINYGEDSILLLKDGNGAIHPLIRDAMMGFREPLILNVPQVRHFGFFIDLQAPQSGKTTSPSRKLSLVAITGPREDAADLEHPSLSQLVLFCDSAKLKYWLDAFINCEGTPTTKCTFCLFRSDGYQRGATRRTSRLRRKLGWNSRGDKDAGRSRRPHILIYFFAD